MTMVISLFFVPTPQPGALSLRGRLERHFWPEEGQRWAPQGDQPQTHVEAALAPLVHILPGAGHMQ